KPAVATRRRCLASRGSLPCRARAPGPDALARSRLASGSSDLLRRPQLGAARAWVAPLLVGIGLERLAREYPGDALVCPRPHAPLDDAVLQRMEADHRDASAGLEQPRRGVERRRQRIQLSV